MSRSIQLYLNDIVESCGKVLRYTQGLSFQVFVADERTYDSAQIKYRKNESQLHPQCAQCGR